MAGTYTSRLALYKPAADGSDNVNVVTDLNNNLDRLDALVSFVPVTVSTYPASAFQGEAFYETDTGKAYVNKSAVASSSDFWQIMVAGADFDSDMTFNGTVVASGGHFEAWAASATTRVFDGQVTGDTNPRIRIDAGGNIKLGPGNASTDLTLSRSSAGVLSIAGDASITGDAIVGGNVTATDGDFSGDLIANGATLRPQLHIVVTHSNSTTEKALQTITIPANDAVAGSTYRIRLFGTATVTGTPTLNFRLRMGDQVTGDNPVTMGAITCRSGMTDGYWEMEAMLTLTANPGATATWYAFGKLTHNFITGVGTYTNVGPIVGTVTKDSTASFDFHLTADWGTASSSNTVVARGGQSGRVG